MGDADVLKVHPYADLPAPGGDRRYGQVGGHQLNQAKEILAYELTKLVHGEAEADKAQGGRPRPLFGGAGGS